MYTPSRVLLALLGGGFLSPSDPEILLELWVTYGPTFLEVRIECVANEVIFVRSEEHTSELQSLRHLVCRLLLEKKKNRRILPNDTYLLGIQRLDKDSR